MMMSLWLVLFADVHFTHSHHILTKLLTYYWIQLNDAYLYLDVVIIIIIIIIITLSQTSICFSKQLPLETKQTKLPDSMTMWFGPLRQWLVAFPQSYGHFQPNTKKNNYLIFWLSFILHKYMFKWLQRITWYCKVTENKNMAEMALPALNWPLAG